jgi:hypothetical protein
MSFQTWARSLLLLFLFQGITRVAAADCLSYEPAVTTLHGTLIRKTFPGPPNYEDIHQGDEAETYWIFSLDSPICVDQNKSEPDLNPAKKDVRQVELVLQPEMYRRYRALLTRRVVATGTLFGAHTSHHHTPVLLTVKSIKRLPSK